MQREKECCYVKSWKRRWFEDFRHGCGRCLLLILGLYYRFIYALQGDATASVYDDYFLYLMRRFLYEFNYFYWFSCKWICLMLASRYFSCLLLSKSYIHDYLKGTIQGYFAITSWFWTTALSYTIYSIISNGAIWYKMWHMKAFCWIFPAIVTLLPITTNDYGTGNPDVQWCLIVPRGNTPPIMNQFWNFAGFFLWLFLSIFLITLWSTIIYCRYWNSVLSDLVRDTYSKVFWYPIAMCCCWMMNFICGLSYYSNRNLVGMSMIFAMSNSIASSLIFMKNNPEVLVRWYKLIRYLCCRKKATERETVGRKSGPLSIISRFSFGSQSDGFLDDDGSTPQMVSMVFSEGSDYFADELFSTTSAVTLRRSNSTSNSSIVSENPLMTQMKTMNASLM